MRPRAHRITLAPLHLIPKRAPIRVVFDGIRRPGRRRSERTLGSLGVRPRVRSTANR